MLSLHIYLDKFFFLNISMFGETQKHYVASSHSLVKYFMDAIELDEDEFLERFFYDYTDRNRSRRQL